MAKSNSFFGLRRGSTKTLTFQVNNGKQITKDRVEIVKNPRTLSQMSQRMVMATASAAYTAMKQICNHSFEGVSYGQQTMSKFISINAGLLRANLSAASSQFGYNEYRDRSLKVGAYQLSDGTLPELPLRCTVSSATNIITVDWSEVGLTEGYNANQLAAVFGLSLGEMATICMVYGNAEATGYNFGFLRIKFVKEGTVALTLSNISEYFTFEANTGNVGISIDPDIFSLRLEDVDIADTSGIAKAVIYSRSGAAGWLRSKAVLSIPAGMVIAPTATTAIATYPVGTDYVLNGGEVNS